MYDAVLFLHILGVLAFVSGIVLAGAAFERARRAERPAEVAVLLGLSRLGAALVGTGTLVIGACGLWLVHLGRWRYGSFWVVASEVLFLTALALGARGGVRPKRARQLASRLAAEGAERTPELTALLEDRPSRIANYVSLVLVLAVIAVMCFKP